MISPSIRELCLRTSSEKSDNPTAAKLVDGISYGEQSVKIKLRLFVTLIEYLPVGGTGNEVDLTIEENTTPLQIINRLNIPFKPPLLIIVDGVKLLPTEVQSRRFKEGETMAIVPPISGG